MTEQYWIYDPSILTSEWYQIFPQKNMSRNQIINSLTRFSIILTFVLICLSSKFIWFTIPFSIFFLAIFMGGIDVDTTNEPSCKEPTMNNPYMNPMLFEKNNSVPCKYNKDNIDSKYDFNLYKNSYDLFDKYHLERQFYTMPVNTITPNFKRFGQWLYNTDSCKNDGERCLLYEDERYH